MWVASAGQKKDLNRALQKTKPYKVVKSNAGLLIILIGQHCLKSEKGKNGFISVEYFTLLGPGPPVDKRFNIVNATLFVFWSTP